MADVCCSCDLVGNPSNQTATHPIPPQPPSPPPTPRDACEYSDGVLNYNQDNHRQRTINWCDTTGGSAAAFDFTTKGVLQEALGRNELWRLVDSQGRPPGMVGMWCVLWVLGVSWGGG